MTSKPFNSSFETGVRCIVILLAMYPKRVDLQRLVYLDYLSVHSGDAEGPESLHAALPMRSAELAVRRQILEAGLLLMRNYSLVNQHATSEGFVFSVTERAGTYLSMLQAPYLMKLMDRASWVADEFGGADLAEFQAIEKRFFQQWSTSFQRLEGGIQKP